MSRGLYLADLVTVIGTQDLVFVRLTVSFYFMHRFYRGLFGIALLYLILALFLFLLYLFLSEIEPLILN